MPPADDRLDALLAIQDALAAGRLRFREAVARAVALVPPGRVLGYGHVAALLGRPRAARQVGFALAALPPDTGVPWWRVVRSDGAIALRGDPVRGPRQARRLRAEGVAVRDWRVDMARHAWRLDEEPGASR